MGRHDSMSKPAEEPRPYCQTHKRFFRNWGSAYGHQGTHKGCILVTKLVKTR